MLEDKQAAICVKCNLMYMDTSMKVCPKCDSSLVRRGIQIITKKVGKDEEKVVKSVGPTVAKH